MRRDKGELHIASLAKYAAAFKDVTLRPELGDLSAKTIDFPLLRPHLAMAGKACLVSAATSLFQRRRTLWATFRSRAARATVTPRSVTNFTASGLNSLLNTRRCMKTSDWVGKPSLGVH